MEGNEAQTYDSANNSGSLEDTIRENLLPRSEEVKSAVNTLVEAFKNGETYAEYERQLRRITAYPDLKARVDEYRRNVFLLQTGRQGDMSMVKQLEQMSEELHNNPVMDDFLNAEIGVCRAFQRMNYMIMDGIGFDPGFPLD